jgi:hypothetical protein
MCLPSIACPWSGGRRTLGAEELSRDVEGLAAYNDNLLSVEQLLSDGAGEATEEVALAVDDLNSQVSPSSNAILPCRDRALAVRTATAGRERKAFV